jgi:hypothetical protein
MDLSNGARKRVTLVAGVAVAALCSAAFASPAMAKSYNLNAGTAATKGKANAKGNVTFPSAKKFKVTGTVRDICPKDGYGAYIEFKISLTGGAYSTQVRKDTTGCKDGALSYSLAHTFGRKIVSVGVTLIEIDADTDTFGDAARKLIKR